jgi:hypothetical protein
LRNIANFSLSELVDDLDFGVADLVNKNKLYNLEIEKKIRKKFFGH